MDSVPPIQTPSKNPTPIILGIIALFILGGGLFYAFGRSDTTDEQSINSEMTIDQTADSETDSEAAETDKVEDEVVAGDESIKTAEPKVEDKEIVRMEAGIKVSGKVLAGTTAPVIDFNQTDYEAALASDKLIVLYFYANWCPLCKAEIPNFYAAMSELSTDTVIGFRVNFNDDETDDAEKAVAREYGVAYQHTKVFVRSRERLLKSPESWDEARYDKEIGARL